MSRSAHSPDLRKACVLGAALLAFVLASVPVFLALPVAAATDEERALAEELSERGVSVEEYEAQLPAILAGITAPRVRGQFAEMALGTQLQVIGSMIHRQPEVVAQYCDPVWVCNIGCGQGRAQRQRPCDNNRRTCLNEAARVEQECANKVGKGCSLSASCRQEHFDQCYEDTAPVRKACTDDHTDCNRGCGLANVACKACCYDSKEGAFDPYGINLCVQRHFPSILASRLARISHRGPR